MKNPANRVTPLQSSVPRVSREKNIPLSFAQQRLWFLDQLEPGTAVYNIPGAFRIKGLLDVGALRCSIEEIVRRHEALRTTFAIVEAEPVQIITPASLFLRDIDLGRFPESEREVEAGRLAAEEAYKPFDLQKGPLFRATLIRLDEVDHLLLVTLHHIVSDGWSREVLHRELSVLYQNFASGEPSPLADLPIQYADFAAWQRKHLSGEVLEAQLSYWKKRLEGAPAVLNLPTDRPRPAIQTFKGARQTLVLSAELSGGLKKLSRKAGVTLYMTLLAAFQSLLHRYTGQDDIVVGSPIANRNRVQIEGLIGFFVNTLVLRADHSGNPTFRELLRRVRETALEAYAHQDLPFEKLVEELRPDRDLGRSPLVQAMFVFQNAAPAQLVLKNLDVSPVQITGDTVKFDLTLSMQEQNGRLSGSLQYNTDLFDPVTVERMARHFITLLEEIAANPDRPIDDLPMLTPTDKRQILIEWNSTGREYAKDRCIHELFEAQAEKTPDAPALVFENRQLTYRELNHRANQVARYLRRLGVGPEVLVGICVERSLDMVIGLLGILKAGGAYVPLDPAYPGERLAFILEDAQAAVLMTRERLIGDLASAGTQMICLDRHREQIEKEDNDNPENRTAPENLAYVIYTSGSTGNPKGVAITHGSCAAFLAWTSTVFTRSEMAGVLASTSVCFDLSVFEIFATLSRGGCVVLAQNALELASLPAARQVTLINTVPSAMVELLRSHAIPPSIGTINMAGEPLKSALVKEIYLRTSAAKVYDLYGPSEDTTYSTFALRTADGPQTIGKPLANTQIYILNHAMEPAPIGVAGELYIGGAGLARGYLKRPDLTAERFIPHPFSTERGARLYKTGDLARYAPDGSIEFLGRIDHQVKIRGFRVELGEIEAVLGRHGGVREALVVAREDSAERQSAALGAEKRLVAYIVSDRETPPAAAELREFIKQKLPDFMVPSAFVFLEALPLTANGKVDRKALPAPELQSSAESFRDPRSPTEIALASIWSEVLDFPRVGLDDNFFDLGGHSLLAARLMTRIKDELGAELPLRILFEGPTIAQLAPKIHSKKQQNIFHQRERGSYAHLFELQAGDNRKPIFCFPFRGGFDGEFFNFTRVARHFDSQYSFYGVLARGLDGISEPHHSIQEMAADYLKEIRSVQPHGPYIFVGECQGGFIAYEAARQIIADGAEMGLLVLLDTHTALPANGFWRRWAAPLKYRAGKSPAWKYFTSRYRYHLQAIRQQSATAALGYGIVKLTRAVSTIPYLIDLEQAETPKGVVSERDRVRLQLDKLRRTFDLAIRRYVLQRYSGRMSLLLNERSYDANFARGWDDYIAAGVDVHKLPGDHDICVPRNIPLVAQILKDSLARLEKQP